MDILPINSISNLDQDIFNLEILNLAKLKRGGFPILEGFAIKPSKEILDKIEIIVQNKNRVDLDSNQFRKITSSEEFKKSLTKSKYFYFKGVIPSEDIWNELLNSWWNEFLVKYRSLQSELQNKIELSDRVIFIINPKSNLFKKIPKYQRITTNHDEIIEDFLVTSDLTIHHTLLPQIDKIIKSAHKFLTLPHNFELIVCDNRIYITGVKPYTDPRLIKKIEKAQIKTPLKNNPKSAIKVYFNLPNTNNKTFISNLRSEHLEDVNCILNGEDFLNFEERVKTVDYFFESFPHSNVIYKLPNISDDRISGSLRLLHQPKLLEDACNFILFLRNKKNMGGLDIAIPHIRSIDELSKIKRELASYNINHKNGMRIWLELCTPENLINIEKYLECDVEGLIINLDRLENLLVGFKVPEEQDQILADDVILELLIKVFKSAHRLNIPIIITGKNYITSGLLETFISWGVYGLVVNSIIEAQSLPYYLALLEKKLIITRLNLPN